MQCNNFRRIVKICLSKLIENVINPDNICGSKCNL